MASREQILAALRRAQPAPTAPLRTPFTVPRRGADEDALCAFETACSAAGGRCLRAGGPSGLADALAAIPEFTRAGRVVSALPGVPRAAPPPPLGSDVRALDGLDFLVAPGVFGVAENGAVFVDAGALGERAALWLAEHLALVVPADAIVRDLHEAYARLRFAAPGFGVFVAGPSKTADIEQALVVGAQGPRSCSVVLLAPSPAPAV